MPRFYSAAPAIFASVAAVASVFSTASQAQPKVGGDPVLGAKVFVQCSICHSVAPDAPSGYGPNLSGVVGAKAGQKPGYSYSTALGNSGLVWTPASLDKFLTKPSAFVPGTRMMFAGIAKPKDRADLIAYLAKPAAAKR